MIGDISPDGAAAREHQIAVGHRIVSVNGESCENLTMDQTVALIKNAGNGAKVLRLERGHGIDSMINSMMDAAVRRDEVQFVVEGEDPLVCSCA